MTPEKPITDPTKHWETHTFAGQECKVRVTYKPSIAYQMRAAMAKAIRWQIANNYTGIPIHFAVGQVKDEDAETYLNSLLTEPRVDGNNLYYVYRTNIDPDLLKAALPIIIQPFTNAMFDELSDEELANARAFFIGCYEPPTLTLPKNEESMPSGDDQSTSESSPKPKTTTTRGTKRTSGKASTGISKNPATNPSTASSPQDTSTQ